MPRTPQEVTDAELAVLRRLWEVGPCSVRQLTERLYPAGSASCYATVQKLLERLEGKRFVRRDRSAAVHTFAPSVCREELIGRRLRTVAAKLCGGSLTPLLAHLVRAEGLSGADLLKLCERIDGKDRPANKKRGRK